MLHDISVQVAKLQMYRVFTQNNSMMQGTVNKTVMRDLGTVYHNWTAASAAVVGGVRPHTHTHTHTHARARTHTHTHTHHTSPHTHTHTHHTSPHTHTHTHTHHKSTVKGEGEGEG